MTTRVPAERMTRPGRLLCVLALLVAAGSGCQTAIGNYFANRARDFSDCFRCEATLGLGLGGGVRGGGIADLGLGVGQGTPLGLGWVYGGGYVGGAVLERGPRPVGDAGEVFLGVLHFDFDLGARGPRAYGTHRCYGFAPAVLSDFEPESELPEVVERHPLWADKPLTPRLRWARVHAFDIEVSAWALLVHTRIGFSPGEFLDFLLGWFGLDLAGDDRPTAAPDR